MAKRDHSLRDSETLRMLVWNLPVGIYITSQPGEVVDANPGCFEIFGVSSLAELRGYSVAELYSDPAQRERELQLLERNGYVSDFELQLRRPLTGQTRTVLDTCYTVPDFDTGEIFFHGILLDVTERRELEGRVEELSVRDGLTGCFNRLYLNELEERLVREKRRWGVIVAAVDHLRQYNIDHGNLAGDQLLSRVGSFLQRQVRSEDIVVRSGGDEFLVLLVDQTADETEGVARRIEQQSREHAPVSFSLGWAAREGDQRLEQTIHRANEALIEVRIRERGPGRRRRPSSSFGPPGDRS